MTTRSSIKIRPVILLSIPQSLNGNNAKILDRFGRVLFIDGHSYPLRCFPFERFPNDLRPEVDIGTDIFHTPKELLTYTKDIFEQNYSVGIDQPFKGTLIPNGFYGKEQNLCAMMLEVRRDVYLKDYDSGFIDIDHAKIQHFHQHLKRYSTILLLLKP